MVREHSQHSPHTPQLCTHNRYGYWEDWCNENEDVEWWDDTTEGHCAGGCVVQKGFFAKAKSYNTLSYAFSTLLKQPKPDQSSTFDVAPVRPVARYLNFNVI